MYTSIFRQLIPPVAQGFKCLSMLAGLAVSFGLSCMGEQSPSLAPTIGAHQGKWIVGPATVKLGDFAELQVPQGYIFLTDTNEARSVFEQNHKALPSDFTGILAPIPGTAWQAVLRFTDIGYVKTASNERIDPAEVLSAIRTKIKLENQEEVRVGGASAPVNSVAWELSPEFDAADRSLECAYRFEYKSDQYVNHSIRLLGRKGVLMATVVRAVRSSKDSAPLAVQSTDLIPLKELMKGVTFKAGEGYADYQAGDKIARVGDVSDLITGKQNEEKGRLAELTNWFTTMDRVTERWMVGGVAACVLLVVVFIVTKEIRSLKLHEAFPTGSVRSGTNGKAQPIRRSSGRQRSTLRKRAFNYQKFYADMMMEASRRPYQGIESQDEEKLEGSHESGASPADPPEVIAANSVTSEFIAQQKAFIEEQRRLMHLQATLIEERSKLIDEKNQILAKQSEMIENHML